MAEAIQLFDAFGPGLFVLPGVSLLRGHEIGSIRIQSGAIKVADPHLLDEVSPLERRCPAGTFPVLIGEAEQEGGSDTFGVCVRFRDVRPATWEPAGGVSIDSASVVVTDAAQADAVRVLAIRDEAMPLPTGHDLFRVGGVAVGAGCRIGGDGGYPVLWGLDGQGQPVSLCVQIDRPERYTRWQPPERCPPLPDLANVDACVAWAFAIPGYDGSLGHPGSIKGRELAALERFAGRRAPAQLLAFYRHCRPWKDDGAEVWQAVARSAGYPAGRGAFPLYAAAGGAMALVPAGASNVVRELRPGGLGALWYDIPSWLVLNGISLFGLDR